MNKKETSLGMYVKADNILVGDLVSYKKFDSLNKIRFEDLPCNKFVVRKIKVINEEIVIFVRHFIIDQYVNSDKIDEFERILLQ